MLQEFMAEHREEIILRCRAKGAARLTPQPTEAEINRGVPLFLDQLLHVLRCGMGSNPEIGRSATVHGHDLLLQGFTVAQVVNDYGDICQSITDLALEMGAPISTDDFRTLNRCLDDAIAAAVTEYGAERHHSTSEPESADASERAGFLAHEAQNFLHTAMLALRCSSGGVRDSQGAPGPTSIAAPGLDALISETQHAERN